MHVDTGADATFAHRRMERHMRNKRKSNSVIQVAKDGVTMPTSIEGTLQAFALSTAGHEGIGDCTAVAIEVITVPDLYQELLSVEEFYRDRGYDVFMMQPGHDLRSGISCRGLRHRAYSRRIPRETQPVFSVRFASEAQRTMPSTSGRIVAEVAYMPPRQTPIMQTFCLGWSAAIGCGLQAWGSKAHGTKQGDLSSDSSGRGSAS